MRKITLVLLCIVVMLQLTGCWNRREPIKLAVMNSALYDIKDDGVYNISIELLNTAGESKDKSSGGGGESKSTSIQGEGKSIPEAIRDLSSSVERRVYIAHNKATFFSEAFAKRGMSFILDFFLRDHEYRQSPYIIVVKGDKPELINDASKGLTDSIGAYFENIARSQMSSKSDAAFVTTLEFAKDYYLDGKEPVASVVEAVEEKQEGSDNGDKKSSGSEQSPKYKLETSGLAAFKDDKFVGYMNGVEARAYNLVVNKFKSAFISIASAENANEIAFEVISSKSDIKTSMQQDKVTLDVNVSMKLNITQYGAEGDIVKKEELKKVEEKFNKKLEEEIISAINKAQKEFKSDIFGFGLFFHIDNPKQWKEIKTKWNDYFTDAKVNVKVDASVYALGEMKKPFVVEED